MKTALLTLFVVMRAKYAGIADRKSILLGDTYSSDGLSLLAVRICCLSPPIEYLPTSGCPKEVVPGRYCRQRREGGGCCHQLVASSFVVSERRCSFALSSGPDANPTLYTR